MSFLKHGRYVKMTHKGFEIDKAGFRHSVHTCDACGENFTICPPVEPGSPGDEDCGCEGCPSYDPDRDMDIMFMTDAEIARDKPLVSIKMLQKRKAYQAGEPL